MNAIPAADLLLTVIFVFCLATLAAGALLAVFSTRLIRSVCGLAVCSVGLAGLYYFLHSPFLALMEILIYVGAVCVTLVFAIMLAEPHEPPNTESRGAGLLWGGASLGVAMAIFCALAWLGTQSSWISPKTLVNDGSIAAIGVSLLTTYSLAFELISLALLVAILGALALARTGRSLPPSTESRTQGIAPLPLAVPGTEAAERRTDGQVAAELMEVPELFAGPNHQQGARQPAPIALQRPLEESHTI
ncbi:MAG TPA: NADH-quinone oxidoreductase subunit J [Verrucomicrobiae bacterium]|nr:NADH-quinone oxidoreductase subunit J [Verrucomicrobiae bacterium]